MRFFSYVAYFAILLSLAGCSNSDSETPSSSETETNQTANESAVSTPLNLDFIHPDFAFATIFNVDRIKQHPAFDTIKGFFSEKELERMRRDMDMDPLSLSQAIFLAGPMPLHKSSKDTKSRDDKPLGIILRFSEPMDRDEFCKSYLRKWEDVEHNGKTYALQTPHKHSALYFADDRTAMYAPVNTLKKMMENKNADSPLRSMLAKANADKDFLLVAAVEPLRETFEMSEEMLQRDRSIPPQLVQLSSMADTTKSVVAEVDLTGSELLRIHFECSDGKTSTEIETMATEGLELLKGLYAQMGAPMLKQNLPSDTATPLLDIAQNLLDGLKIDRTDSSVSLWLQRPAGLGELPEILAPLVEEEKRKAEVTRKQVRRMLGLKNISNGFQEYSARRRSLPASYSSNKDGKPLLSWRVELLPFLGETKLYNEFKKDEPWDSEHNQKLIDRMPRVYGDNSEGQTRYQLFVSETSGKEITNSRDPNDRLSKRNLAAFRNGKRTSYSITSLDGATNTIMIVETAPDKSVPWTKPADVLFDPINPAKALGKISKDGFLTCFFDGHVVALPKDTSAKNLKAMVTPRGREPISAE